MITGKVMEQKFEQKLSVIIVGNAHADYTLYPILTRLFKKIHQDKIPCAFLEEYPGGRSLDESMLCVRGEIEAVRAAYPDLMRDCDKSPVNVGLLQNIMQMLMQKFMPFIASGQLSPGMLSQEMLSIYFNHAKVEKIKFYDILKSLKIYYTGIDLAETEYNKRVIAGCNDEASRNQNEPVRIAAMVKNSYTQICNKFSTGGIVFISTGAMHAHRLGANLLLEHNKKRSIDLDLDIKVFDCLSEYVTDYTQEMSKLIGFDAEAQIRISLLAGDSPKIKQIYQTFPITKVKINKEGRNFSAPLLEKSIDTLISASKKSDAVSSVAISPATSTTSSMPNLLPGQIKFFDIARTHHELFKQTHEDLYRFNV